MEQLEEIIQRYNHGENTRTIGRDFGLSYETIRQRLKQAGVPRRTRSELNTKYAYKHDAFEHFEPITAYWAGLMAADGCVHRTGLISLELDIKDKELVEGLAQFIEYTGPIIPRTRRQKSGFISSMTALRVTAPDLAKQLLAWGVVQRKTYEAKRIILPPELECHFYRGLFDGDGCLHRRKTGQLCASLAKHPVIIDGFRDWCWRTFREPRSLSRKPKYHLVQFGGKSASLLGQALYSSHGPRLTRKNDLVKEWI